LTATELDVSVLPLSIVIEVAESRRIIRDLIDGGHPHLVLRFAAGTPDDLPARSPRLPAGAIIDYASARRRLVRDGTDLVVPPVGGGTGH
jgi:hypothetical protein